MSSTDIVIKSEKHEKRPHKRHRVYEYVTEPSSTQSGVLVIPASSTGNSTSSKRSRAAASAPASIANVRIDKNSQEITPTQSGILVIPAHSTTHSTSSKHASLTPIESANVMVIPNLDIKGTRLQILGNWRGYTPTKIVGIFRRHYENMRSLAVMLSRMKKDLKGLDDPPPEEYLSKIAMSKKEYNEIRRLNNDVRKKGAMSVSVIANADAIVLQAMQYMTSSNPNLLYCGLLIVTGMRPIEIAKMAAFSTKLNNEQGEKSPWFACQTRFAKRGTMKTAYNQCRDRCFLVPYWLVERALEKVRRRWPVKHLNNVDINRKFSTHWGKILVKAFPQWPGITARLCRRFFAVYAYQLFGRYFFMDGSAQGSLIGFCSWMLGHASLDEQAIAYQSLVLRPHPKLKLMQLGKELRVKSRSSIKKDD